MSETPPSRPAWRWKPRPEELLGALAVLVSRLMTLPRSPWELDELLFTRAVIDFEPLYSRPHPPGYPLLVGLGKLAHLVVSDPWFALVIVSLVSTIVGFVAFARAATRVTGDRATGCIAALIFYFSASMLVHGSLALSDAPMLMFTSLALLASARYAEEGTDRRAAMLGIWLSAAIGTRPQMAIPLVPLLALGVLTMRSWRHRALALFFFALISLLWFGPLVDEAGGWNDFMALQKKQATYFAEHDAEKSRGAHSLAGVAVRFILHPWGPKTLALPVMLLAAAGFAQLVRKRRWLMLPALALTVIHVGFALLAMDPADAARYSLPSMLLVAMLAAAGAGIVSRALRFPAAGWILALLLAIGSFAYASPILLTRHRIDSPPAQAAAHAQAYFPPSTVILYDLSLRPHAEHLFERFKSRPTEAGLSEYYARPDVPLVHLADGGSPMAGAKMFSWPASDAYGKLTRNHYRVVSLEPVPPATRFLPLRGVSAPERTATGLTWRWLGPEAALRLPQRKATRLTLRLGLSSDTPYVDNRVRIVVDGVEQASAIVTREGVEIDVPLSTATRHEVTILSERSFVPAATTGNRDGRRLAVQLFSLEQR